MTKQLVAYFSATGTTKRAAQTIARLADADLYEIRPETPYSREDLNWQNSKSRSYLESRNLSFRPQLADKDAKVEDYETIYIGFPIWWYCAPTIINSFLEAYDFSNKNIVLFATSMGSRMGDTQKKLELSCPDSVKWLSEKILRNESERNLEKWINGINA